MPLLKTIHIKDGILLFWEMNKTEDPLSLLPEAMSDQSFLRLTGAKRKMEWIAVRALLLAAGCKTDQLRYLDSGQPCIGHPEFSQISISHSDRLAGLFLHKHVRIGLDIENENRDFARVEKKYLSAGEIMLARSLPDGLGFFWGIKEAVYKAAGVPGLIFSRQIRISLTQEGIPRATLLHEGEHPFEIICTKLQDQLIVYAIASPGYRVVC